MLAYFDVAFTSVMFLMMKYSAESLFEYIALACFGFFFAGGQIGHEILTIIITVQNICTVPHETSPTLDSLEMPNH